MKSKLTSGGQSLGSLSGTNRASVLVERGQSLIQAGNGAVSGAQNTERSNVLRQSAGSQIGNR